MPVPTAQSLSQYQTTFVNAYVSALDPSFGVVAGNIPRGDPALALGFASAAVAITIQKLVIDLYDFSRASTCVTEADLDSWLADFGFSRPPGAAAQSIVNVPTANGVGATTSIPIAQGSVVQTQPIVVAPSTVPAIYTFVTTQPAVIPIGSSSVNVSVQASQVGAQYNLIPQNTPLQFGNSIPGVGLPTFNSPPTLGANRPSNSQALLDFQLFITSLELATYGALVAAIQDSDAALINNQNFVLYDYASYLAITGASVTAVLPGQIVCALVEAGKNGQYTGSPDDPTADLILAAMQRTAAFGTTPLVYFAKQYPISAVSISFTYSQNASANALLNLTQLENLITALLQATWPSGGGKVGQKVYFAQLVRQILDLTQIVNGTTIGGMVIDVNVPTFSLTTTGGGTFVGSSADFIGPGSPSTFDALGYLSLAANLAPTYIAASAP